MIHLTIRNDMEVSQFYNYQRLRPLKVELGGGGNSFLFLDFKRLNFWGGGDFLLEGWRYPPPNQLKILPGSIKSFTLKENYIGSLVSEILRYRQNNCILYIIGLSKGLYYHLNILDILNIFDIFVKKKLRGICD